MLTFKGRKEDMRLVRGQGQYSSDWNLPGQLHACFLRADRAHAIIRSIDAAAAKRMDGVVVVLDGNDIADAGMRTLPPTVPYAGRDGARILMPERPALARERVRYVGEEIVAVIAETVRQAMDATEQISVEYDDLPPVIGFDAAERIRQHFAGERVYIPRSAADERARRDADIRDRMAAGESVASIARGESRKMSALGT